MCIRVLFWYTTHASNEWYTVLILKPIQKQTVLWGDKDPSKKQNSGSKYKNSRLRIPVLKRLKRLNFLDDADAGMTSSDNDGATTSERYKSADLHVVDVYPKKHGDSSDNDVHKHAQQP